MQAGRDPSIDDRAAQIEKLRSRLEAGSIDQAQFEARRNEIAGRFIPNEVSVPYRVRDRTLFAAILFIGAGMFFVWLIPNPPPGPGWIRVIEAVLAAFLFAGGALILVAYVRAARSKGPALVIDRDGISIRYPLRRSLRVPWSEVAGVRERTFELEYASARYVEIDLRAPIRRLRVPPRDPRPWSRARGRLVLSERFLDISDERLVELIQRHLDMKQAEPPTS
jgi:hypothetical protein